MDCNAVTAYIFVVLLFSFLSFSLQTIEEEEDDQKKNRYIIVYEGGGRKKTCSSDAAAGFLFSTRSESNMTVVYVFSLQPHDSHSTSKIEIVRFEKKQVYL